jgi:hypothetical protein
MFISDIVVESYRRSTSVVHPVSAETSNDESIHARFEWSSSKQRQQGEDPVASGNAPYRRNVASGVMSLH